MTDDVTRLVGEIRASRDDRGRLMQDLRHATAEMRRAVAGMQSGFRSDHADMTRRQQRMLHGFVSGLKTRVATFRKEFANDLAGARKVWAGAEAMAMPGRNRRGGKWFAGETA